MRIISTYVFRQAAGSFLLILVSLTGVVWIALALRQFNVVTSEGQDTWMLVKMTSMAVPNLMAIIAPFSFLIAALHTLNRLNTDSELIVISASGAKVWTAARPLLLLALLVSLFLALVAHVIQPWSMQRLREYMVEVRTDLLTEVIQPGRFSSPEENLVFHIRDRAADGELLGLVMHDTRDKHQSQTYLAERGDIVKQDDTAYLVMSAGDIIRRTDEGGPPQIVAFDRYVVDLDRFEPQHSGSRELKPRERYWSGLVHPDPDSRLYKRDPGKFRSELHERLTAPLYPLAFVFLIIALVGQARSTRSSRFEGLVAAFVLGALCRLVGLALTNGVAQNAALIVPLYGLPLGIILFSLILIKRSERQKSGGFAERLADAFASIAEATVRLVSRVRQRRAIP